jgi:hypothetical protein
MLPLLLVALLAIPLTAVADQPLAWEIHAAGEGIIDANEPFEAVALSWSSPTHLALRVRTSMDGIVWSEWIPAAIDEDLTDHAARRYYTSIMHTGLENRYLEYSFAPAEAERDVRALVATFFAPPGPRTPVEPVLSENLTLGILSVRSRTDWGCPDGQGSRWTPAYTSVTHTVVHHTAGANSVSDWDAEMRNIWYFHTVTRGWGDIGYNYLIAPNGVIFEGRAGGPGAIGAHFSCRNTNTAGIALLGTFTGSLPSPEALEALTRLLTELSRWHRIKPNMFAFHVPTALNLPTIPGHRDANPSPQACSATECPGDALYSYLPTIRSDVAACPPMIIAQPVSTSIAAGGSAELSVTAGGTEPLTYQWYVGESGNTENPLEGAIGASLITSPTTTTSYWVRVATSCGLTDSEAALVAVRAARRRGARR